MSDLKHTPFQADPLYDNEIETSVDDLRIRVDVDPDGRLDTDEVRALRDHIVLAVNAHDELVAALKTAMEWAEAPMTVRAITGAETLDKMRSALAKAEGKP